MKKFKSVKKAITPRSPLTPRSSRSSRLRGHSKQAAGDTPPPSSAHSAHSSASYASASLEPLPVPTPAAGREQAAASHSEAEPSHVPASMSPPSPKRPSQGMPPPVVMAKLDSEKASNAEKPDSKEHSEPQALLSPGAKSARERERNKRRLGAVQQGLAIVGNSAFASSAATGAHTAEYAVGGLTTGFWQSHPDDARPVWGVMFSFALEVSSVDVHWQGDCLPSSVELQLSTNGQDYESLMTIAVPQRPTGSTLFMLDTPTRATHMRLVCDAYHRVVGIYDVRVNNVVRGEHLVGCRTAKTPGAWRAVGGPSSGSVHLEADKDSTDSFTGMFPRPTPIDEVLVQWSPYNRPTSAKLVLFTLQHCNAPPSIPMHVNSEWVACAVNHVICLGFAIVVTGSTEIYDVVVNNRSNLERPSPVLQRPSELCGVWRNVDGEVITVRHEERGVVAQERFADEPLGLLSGTNNALLLTTPHHGDMEGQLVSVGASDTRVVWEDGDLWQPLPPKSVTSVIHAPKGTYKAGKPIPFTPGVCDDDEGFQVDTKGSGRVELARSGVVLVTVLKRNVSKDCTFSILLEKDTVAKATFMDGEDAVVRAIVTASAGDCITVVPSAQVKSSKDGETELLLRWYAESPLHDVFGVLDVAQSDNNLSLQGSDSTPPRFCEVSGNRLTMLQSGVLHIAAQLGVTGKGGGTYDVFLNDVEAFCFELTSSPTVAAYHSLPVVKGDQVEIRLPGRSLDPKFASQLQLHLHFPHPHSAHSHLRLTPSSSNLWFSSHENLFAEAGVLPSDGITVMQDGLLVIDAMASTSCVLVVGNKRLAMKKGLDKGAVEVTAGENVCCEVEGGVVDVFLMWVGQSGGGALQPHEQYVHRVLSHSSQYDSESYAAKNVQGPPDVYPRYGDIAGAWAPKQSKGTDEFLEVALETPCLITQVHVYETYNPGSLVKISVRESFGEPWEEIWSGEAERDLPDLSRVNKITVRSLGRPVQHVRLDMDCKDSKSWYEIDAIKVMGFVAGASQRSKRVRLAEARPVPAAFCHFADRSLITVPRLYGEFRQFTLATWVHFDRVHGVRAIRADEGRDSGSLHLHVKDGALVLAIMGASPGELSFKFGFKAHRWYHIAVSCATKSGDVVLFVNGQRMERKRFGFVAPWSPGQATIGNWNHENNFEGYMADFNVFNNCLDNDDVVRLMKGERTDKYAVSTLPLGIDSGDIVSPDNEAVEVAGVTFGVTQVATHSVANLERDLLLTHYLKPHWALDPERCYSDSVESASLSTPACAVAATQSCYRTANRPGRCHWWAKLRHRVEVNAVKIEWADGELPEFVQLEVSDDGVAWETASSELMLSRPQPTVLEVDPPLEANWIRVVMRGEPDQKERYSMATLALNPLDVKHEALHTCKADSGQVDAALALNGPSTGHWESAENPAKCVWEAAVTPSIHSPKPFMVFVQWLCTARPDEVSLVLDMEGKTVTLPPVRTLYEWTALSVPSDKLPAGHRCVGLQLVMKGKGHKFGIVNVLYNPSLLVLLDLGGQDLAELDSLAQENVGFASVVDISGNKLKHVPADLMTQKLLNTLNATLNELAAIPPLPESTAKLHVAHNNLVVVPPCALDLTNLSHLDISFNSIRELPEQLATLPFLRVLHANHCLLTALPDCLMELPLVELGIAGNPFPEGELFKVSEGAIKALEELEERDATMQENRKNLDAVSGLVCHIDATRGKAGLNRVQNDDAAKPMIIPDARNNLPAWRFNSGAHLRTTSVESLTGAVTIAMAVRPANNEKKDPPAPILCPFGAEAKSVTVESADRAFVVRDGKGMELKAPSSVDGDWHVLVATLHANYQRGGAGVDSLYIDGERIVRVSSQYGAPTHSVYTLFHSLTPEHQATLWFVEDSDKQGFSEVRCVGTGSVLTVMGYDTEAPYCVARKAKEEAADEDDGPEVVRQHVHEKVNEDDEDEDGVRLMDRKWQLVEVGENRVLLVSKSGFILTKEACDEGGLKVEKAPAAGSHQDHHVWASSESERDTLRLSLPVKQDKKEKKEKEKKKKGKKEEAVRRVRTKWLCGGVMTLECVDEPRVIAHTFNGDVGELLVFNQALDKKQRRIVEDHLSHKWLSDEQKASSLQSSWRNMYISKCIDFATQYDSDRWSAAMIEGVPQVYPRYGDIHGAWAPKSSSGTLEHLEFEYESPILLFSLAIFETNCPGAVVKVSAKHPDTRKWVEIYSGEAQNQDIPQETRIFRPSIEPPSFKTAQFRLDLDCTQASSYSEIDAVMATGLYHMDDTEYAYKQFKIWAKCIDMEPESEEAAQERERLAKRKAKRGQVEGLTRHWVDTVSLSEGQQFTVLASGCWKHEGKYYDANGRLLSQVVKLNDEGQEIEEGEEGEGKGGEDKGEGEGGEAAAAAAAAAAAEAEEQRTKYSIVGLIGGKTLQLGISGTYRAPADGVLRVGCYMPGVREANDEHEGHITVAVARGYDLKTHSYAISPLTSVDLSGLPKFVESLSLKTMRLPAHAKPILPSAKTVNLTDFKMYVSAFPFLTHKFHEGKRAQRVVSLARKMSVDGVGRDAPLAADADESGKDPAESLFFEVDDNHNGILEGEELPAIEQKLFDLYPPRQCPTGVFSLLNLKSLKLRRMGLKTLPPEIKQLRFCLESLDVSYNPITELPSELGNCTKIVELRVDGCDQLHTPPVEVVARGTRPMLSYLKALSQEQEPVYRTKLMFVGLGGVGKTSVCKALTGKTYEAKSTDGIDVDIWVTEVKERECRDKPDMVGKSINLQLFDFAGQEVYYTTHALFLSARAIYLVIWNVRLGWVHSGVEYWLRSIRSHAPSATVIIVGTHCDQVPQPSLPEDTLRARFPQIKAFVGVATGPTKLRMDELRSLVLESAVNESYMGELRPKSWLDLERQLMEMRMDKDYIDWQTFLEICQNVAIFDDEVASEASGFLHDLGAIIHHNDYEARMSGLADLLILNPQWLADVCKCVITAQASHVEHGILDHSLLPKVWKAFKKDLHPKLLELLQKFELMRRLPDDGQLQRSLVPSLLPEQPPDGLDLNKFHNPDGTYTFQKWTFEFLPSGAFARIQVRLQQLSSSALTAWRYGVVLEKNGHSALVAHDADDMLIVATVLGPEPANLLSIVHFAINGLKESFAGLDFDVHVPCPVCVSKREADADLFSLQRSIKRAKDFGVKYLQCRSYFHQIPTTSFLAELPASSPEDHRLRMEAALQAVKLLRSALQTPFFISHSKHVAADAAVAKRVHKLLADNGIQCYLPVLGNTDKDVDVAALNSAQYFLIIVSERYSSEEETVGEATYIKKQLKRPVIPVTTVAAEKWTQSQVGLLISNLLWIEFKDDKASEALVARCRKFLAGMEEENQKQGEHQEFKAMLSYCWANSKDARDQGQVPDVIGFADPRAIKFRLDKLEIPTWLDVEHLGYESDKGLFDGILEGLKGAKVVVACVSNQYAASANCRMEFTYALKMLRKPVIMCIVGVNDGASCWEESEVGLLSNHCPFFGTRCPSVDFRNVHDEKDLEAKMDEVHKHVNDALQLLEQRQEQSMHAAPKPEAKEEKRGGGGGAGAAGGAQGTTSLQAFREQAENIRRSFLLSLGKDSENTPRLLLLVPDGIMPMCEEVTGFHLLMGPKAKVAMPPEDVEALMSDPAVSKYQNEIWDILDTCELDARTQNRLQELYGKTALESWVARLNRQRDAGAGLGPEGLVAVQKEWRRLVDEEEDDEEDRVLTQLVLPTKETLLLCNLHYGAVKANLSAAEYAERVAAKAAEAAKANEEEEEEDE